ESAFGDLGSAAVSRHWPNGRRDDRMRVIGAEEDWGRKLVDRLSSLRCRESLYARRADVVPIDDRKWLVARRVTGLGIRPACGFIIRRNPQRKFDGVVGRGRIGVRRGEVRRFRSITLSRGPLSSVRLVRSDLSRGQSEWSYVRTCRV